MYGQAAGVLTNADIRKLRHYVQHKHGALPNERRAEIVADAMQRIVLRQLPDFPEDAKHTVMRALIRDVAAGKALPVNEALIYETCMQLDTELPELLRPLHAWCEKRAGIAIDPARFREALAESRVIAASPELGLSAWDAVVGAAGLRDSGRFVPRGAFAAEALPVRLPEPVRLPARKAAKLPSGAYLAMSLALCAAMLGYGWWSVRPVPAEIERPRTIVRIPAPTPPVVKQKNALPAELRYAEVDRERLVRYLRGKSSLLADEPYLSAILHAAKEHDIHPLLLFAITGQEQAFVPKTAKNAAKIANNPFNVFYSWKAFNTTIAESARIAGNTINRLSFDRPERVDAVTWINREYAEDPNWSKGVNSLFNAMLTQITADSKR
ncbi:glucosaminidase domain-containing protein [Paenibacillus sp. MWE-103]|uniref:Glucosaminidase domain-containing protein n=1 Tax=Paenibacillus artemisiicola TaxID=1172618 RepID=A0ABS3WCH7_9BACL|nr:glucosaminidase domain-containing protein [Paenibacillus artemisiicola]MBO7746013.1 glucosaminidase domain-containing protein [Paenibacillus artemisiicola]